MRIHGHDPACCVVLSRDDQTPAEFGYWLAAWMEGKGEGGEVGLIFDSADVHEWFMHRRAELVEEDTVDMPAGKP